MRKIFTGLVLAAAMTTSLGAQEVLAPDPGIESTIRSQMEAFRAEDVTAAFEFASPTIRNLFRTPENFGVMVQRGYPMVWRPEDVTFGALREIAGALWQRVIVTDADGKPHYLDYRMEMIDGAWRISAVQILQMPAVAA